MTLRVIFMGTPAFAVPSLQALLADAGMTVCGVLTQPDRPAGRGNKLTPPPVKEHALSAGLPVYQPERLRKDTDLIAWLAQQQPDFLVTAAFGQILPQAVLDIPRYGTVNVHASLLPRYRGANPIQWAILNGESQAGVTTMLTVLAVDAGPMLEQASLDIGPDEDTASLTQRLALLGAQILPGSLHRLAQGHLIPQSQDATLATHAGKLRKEDAAIDWSQPAPVLHNKIRAQHPWPGTLTWLGDTPLKLIASTLLSPPDAALLPNMPPGSILKVTPDGVAVQTGHGILMLITVQPAGKPKMPARDWANGALGGLDGPHLIFTAP